MLFAGQPVADFACSELIQSQMDLMKQLRYLYQMKIQYCSAGDLPSNWFQVHYQRLLECPPGQHLIFSFLQHVAHSCLATQRATEYAIRHGIGINLGGGFHHATLYVTDANNGCLINDVLLAIRDSIAIHNKRIVIVDLDAHRGGGTVKGLNGLSDLSITILDAAETELSDSWGVQQEVSSESGAKKYRQSFNWLFQALTEKSAEIVFFNIGADVTDRRFMSSPMSVRTAIRQRIHIIDYCRNNKIPLVITLGGGYTPEALAVWQGVIGYCLALAE